MRGKTLVSPLILAIKSFDIGELKYTYALQHKEIMQKVQSNKQCDETEESNNTHEN